MKSITRMAICQQCEKSFIPKNKRGMVPSFCSNACKQKNYRQTRNTDSRPVANSTKKLKPEIKKSRNAIHGPGNISYEKSREKTYYNHESGCQVIFLNGHVQILNHGHNWIPAISESGVLTFFRIAGGE